MSARNSGHSVLVTSKHDRFSSGLRSLWQQRDLLDLLVRREVFVRYRQSLLGVLWIGLEPLAILAVMSVVFSVFLRVDTGGIPYPLFAFTALVPWMLFSKTVSSTASSLDKNLGLASKARVPRLAFPVSEALRELVDSLVLILVLITVSLFWGFDLAPRILLVIPLLFATAIAALGLGLWVAGLMTRVRDFRFFLTIVLQAGMYVTPIFYPADLVPEQFQPVYQMNPMYWVVAASRYAILGVITPITASLVFATSLVVTITLAGLYLFNYMQRTAIDVQ